MIGFGLVIRGGLAFNNSRRAANSFAICDGFNPENPFLEVRRRYVSTAFRAFLRLTASRSGSAVDRKDCHCEEIITILSLMS